MSPLMNAAENGDVESAKRLLDQGADVNEHVTALKWTALHVAAWKGQAEVARLLIRRGADVDAVTGANQTALQLARVYGKENVAAVILAETGRATKTPVPEKALSLHASALVMELKAVGAVPGHVPSLVTKILLAKLDDVVGLRTVSPEDIQLMLSVEKQKDALGCDDVKCIAEIGGALGVDLVISGQIGIMGSQYNLNLTAIDAKRSLVVARVSVQVASTEDALTQSVPAAVASLLAKIARDH